MTAAENKPEFPRITLKYKTVETFALVAKTTFTKGRMTLKTKKKLAEGQRIILIIKFPQIEPFIEIISEIIQKVPAGQGEETITYGVRWLNFTQKKMDKFLEEVKKTAAGPAGTAPKPASPTIPFIPPRPESMPPPPAEEKSIPGEALFSPGSAEPAAAAPEPAVSEIPPSPETAPPAPPEEPPSTGVLPEKDEVPSTGGENALPVEEVVINSFAGSEYPHFEEPPQDVIFPPASENEPLESGVDLSAAESGPPQEDQAGGIVEGSLPEGPEFSISEAIPAGPVPLPEPETVPPFAPDTSPVSVEAEGKDVSPEAEQGRADLFPGEEEPVAGGLPEPEPSVPSPGPPPAPPVEAPASAAVPEESEEPLPELPSATPPEAEKESETAGPPQSEEEEEVPSAPEEGREPQRPLSAEELNNFGLFLQKLVKLILQSEKVAGPEGERLTRPLFEEFKELMRSRDEIVLYSRSLGRVREFMLAGDILGPVNLKTALSAELFNEVVVKLVEFFGSKRLCGFQFRKYLTEDAFRKFIQRLGQYDPATERPEDLAAGLIQDGVFHITPIHESERLSGAADLDFRVDMTIARLRGELKQLKILAQVMSEDPAAVFTLRVEDALKALPEGVLRAQLLLRGEMIVAGQEEISRSDLVQEIIMATPVEMLAEAGGYLAERFEELFGRTEQAAESEKETLQTQLEQCRWVLRQVAARLTVESPEAAAEIMGGLYRRGVFTLEELPPQLRERIMLEQFLELFLQAPDQRLTDFTALSNLKAYKIAANRYVRMIVELVRRGEMVPADKIFRTLLEHARARQASFPERPAAAREALAQVGNPAAVGVLTAALANPAKEERDKVAAMLLAAGPAVAEPLIDLLGRVQDRSVRRLICEILTRLGPSVAPLISARIKNEDTPWYLVRNLVMILADLNHPALKDDLERFLRHEHPRVREESLVYAVKVLGTDSEPLLVRALSDPEAVVRRKSVRLLSRFAEIGDSTRLALLRLVEAKPQVEPGGEEEQAFVAAVENLCRSKTWTTPDGRKLEDVFLEILEEETPGFFSRLTGAKSLRSPAMRAALIDGLAKVGTAKAKKLLGNLAKDKDPQVKQAAVAALKSLNGKS